MNAKPNLPERVWMDQGGTFTDVVSVGLDGALHIRKVPSHVADLEALGQGAKQVRRGTTTATNALLEGRGVATLLIVTRGFGDMPWIGDQTRPDLFSLSKGRPQPLCTGVLEVAGRIDSQGHETTPHLLDQHKLEEALAQGMTSVAIVLVHGPLNPAIETRLRDVVLETGFCHVSVGHEVAPSRGFLARLETTLVDAATTPLLPTAPGQYMRSDGGLAERSHWRGRDALLSGPAGGVVAAAHVAHASGETQAFGLDMGGTSTDVCRVAGAPTRTDRLRIAGRVLRLPAVELETVAAGGGSRLFVRAGVYAVGPESAGANPGPACYGRGGPATVTDAEAVLGRLPVFPNVCGPSGHDPLDRDAAVQATSALDPDRPAEEVAWGFRQVAAENMARAVRQLAARHGVDPTHHALIAFGGAGPAHACGVATRLDVDRVIVPFAASALSAVGIGLSRPRAETVEPIHDGDVLTALRNAVSRLPFDGTQEARVAMRHRGTSSLLEVPLTKTARHASLEGPRLIADLETRFHHAHLDRYGFERRGLAVEAVEVRVSVERLEDAPDIVVGAEDEAPETARAWFQGWQDVPCRALENCDGLAGPALLIGHGTTVVVDPGWRAEMLPIGVRLRHETRDGPSLGTSYHPIHTAVFGSQIMAIAEQMGERLKRLAQSVNIRERLDFSCAVFDREGYLCANAPHIPVHLGAMGETVRAMLNTTALQAGQCWVSNDPYVGGSHLPDITVVAPFFAEGRREGFVGCRGHHVDVGGVTPGSMPPFSKTIEEEGLRIPPTLLVEDGRFIDLPLPGCRAPEVVRADLEAQVAACTAGLVSLEKLYQEVGAEAFVAQLRHLQEHSRRTVQQVLRARPGKHHAVEVLDDGTRIEVSLLVEPTRATLNVQGTRHAGNLNAPAAVARAALLYTLRCLVQEAIPLNEGALRPLTIHLEPRGLFDPCFPTAVAGGNVETSQRLVDALLRALGAQAGSQGTMNNLTLGFDSGEVWYETIAGGAGAGPDFDGPSAIQVHMTNTRATDVEELEARFPIELEAWTLRYKSGGRGNHRGGDGILKTWRFLAPAEVCLMCERREQGAPGLGAGKAGLPGCDEVDRGAGWMPAPRRWQAKRGDRLRIATPGGGGCTV